ncbi:hypothetical protein [Escherichia coli]|uniref:hypothetical protein n=1 Tax=Escherichia coli TaxID=562 RepID=UPI000BE4696B|nr:hypothetical protein [Escherichia coli]
MSVFYAEGMGGGTVIFHVKLLFDRRYQGELSEKHGTAQRASCKAGFLWQSLRRTARDVSRSGVDVAS